jgi:hypothetical protein
MTQPPVMSAFISAGGLLAIFTLVHFMADWFPQSHRESYEKYTRKLIRLRHSVIYAIHFLPLILWLDMVDWTGLVSLVILVGSHYVIDSYWPIYMWMYYIRRPPEMSVGESSLNAGFSVRWRSFMAHIETPAGRAAHVIFDQTLHVSVLLVVIMLALLY